MSDFIKEVLDATEAAESPRSYFYWSSLAAISAVVRNNVFLSKGGLYDLKPNIYVLLIGPSGVRKGLPVSLAKWLVQGVGNTRVIDGVSSIQKIIDELAQAVTLENGSMITDGTCFLVNDEFSTTIIDDPMSQTYLTTLHDTIYHKDWSYQTKSGGKKKIKAPYMTILGATNIVHMNDFLHKKSITGGFIARTFLVKADRPGRINPLVEKEDPLPLEALTESLRELSKVKGEFSWSDDGKELFKKWYYELREKLADNNHEDTTGTMNRLHDQGLKIAMLLSISRAHGLVLEYTDMEDAIRSCTEFQSTMNEVTAGSGISDMSLKINMLITDLLRAVDRTLSHKSIIRRRFGDFTVEELGKMIDLLSQGGLIEIIRGQELKYKLTDKATGEFGGLIK